MTLFSVILLIIITLIVGGFTYYTAYEFHYEDIPKQAREHLKHKILILIME